MTSQIDPTKPDSGNAYTADMRANFAAAKAEIEALTTSFADANLAIDALNARIAALEQRSQIAATGITLDPPNTTSAVFVMSGNNVEFVPQGTRGVMILEGQLGNTSNGASSQAQLVYGEGTPPPAGTPLTSTNGILLGVPTDMMAAKPNDSASFTMIALLTDLTPGDTYWLGCALRAVSGTATLSAMNLVAFALTDAIG